MNENILVIRRQKTNILLSRLKEISTYVAAAGAAQDNKKNSSTDFSTTDTTTKNTPYTTIKQKQKKRLPT